MYPSACTYTPHVVFLNFPFAGVRMKNNAVFRCTLECNIVLRVSSSCMPGPASHRSHPAQPLRSALPLVLLFPPQGSTHHLYVPLLERGQIIISMCCRYTGEINYSKFHSSSRFAVRVQQGLRLEAARKRKALAPKRASIRQ